MVDDSKAGSGETRRTRDPESPDLFSIRVSVTRETFERLLKQFDLDVGCRPHVHANADGTGSLTAFATTERIRELEAAGYKVEIGENASEIGRQRQAEVGKGDRFEGGRVVPRGLGHKTSDRHEGGPRQ